MQEEEGLVEGPLGQPVEGRAAERSRQVSECGREKGGGLTSVPWLLGRLRLVALGQERSQAP